MTQLFKGDENELKYYAAGLPAFQATSDSLDEMYDGAFDAAPFLLMLYDEDRIPFSQRVNRNAFVDFIRQTLKLFPFIGSFDTYLFILSAIFGEQSEIFFEVPAPGKLSISVNATSTLEFEFIGREPNGLGGYTLFNVSDSLGNDLIFRGVSGIETEYDLELLFSEIMPVGIVPDIALTFFTYYSFVADEGGTLYEMITSVGDEIIFYEVGG